MDRSRLDELHNAVRRVVKRAARPGGSLEGKSFTMAMARGEVEELMGLQGQLGEGEWRDLVKAEVNEALAEIDNITSEEEEVPVPRKRASASSSRRASGRSATQGDKVGPGRSVGTAPARRNARRSENETSEEEEEEEEDQDGTDSGGEEYGAKTVGMVGKGRRGGEVESARGAKGGKGRRRLETPSEEESVGEMDRDQEAGQEEETSDHEKENESEMSSVYDEPPSKSSAKAAAGTTQAKRTKQVTQAKRKGKGDIKAGGRKSGPRQVKAKEDVAELSESEMSSVYDVAPTKKRRSEESNDKSGKKARTKKAKKDPNEGLSPDEAKVNDLKRIVVACGVRKQWSKEFADCPTTKAQIQRLQRILSELGMKGNPTMGKARSLKEARELAAELNDVREFEAARGLSAGRPSRRISGPTKRVIESDDEGPQSDDGEDEEDRKESALGAVLDFLDELSS